MSVTLSVDQIAALVNGTVVGDGTATVHGVATLDQAGPDDITWASTAHFAARLAGSRAGAVLVGGKTDPGDLPAIRCEDVEHAVAQVLGAFQPPFDAPPVGVHPTAVVADSASLGARVAIGPHVVISERVAVANDVVLHAGVHLGAEVTVGPASELWNHVVVRERCVIGARTRIFPHVVIGADGFGYYFRDGVHCKVPHCGRVIIGDDVEIGAGTCIDRSKTGETVIGAGVKIDNLVQVAHNVTVGAGSLLCAQVGLAGSSQLGDHVMLGGQVGVRDNITLHDGVTVGACSCVPQDVPAGERIAGIPAIDARQYMRVVMSLRRLPEFVGRLTELNRRIEDLEAAANDPSNG